MWFSSKRSRCSFNLFLFCVFLFSATSLLLNRFSEINQHQNERDLDAQWNSAQDEVTLTQEQTEDERPLKLLSWTPLNMRTKEPEENWFEEGFDVCRKYYPSPWTPCKYTYDKKQIRDSDAILFRGRRIDIHNLPKYRSPSQKWVFYEFEPPYKVWMYTNLTAVRDLFNVTSTYSRDSDIFKNGYIKKCWYDSAKRLRLEKNLKTTDFASKKKGMVAWFVSVCTTQSRRERYVRQLSKSIPVDIYGECGSLKCGSSVMKNGENEVCDQRLLSQNGSYKFYLAFENSFCPDYITEKLWKLSKYEVVPIVMGAVDYANMRPSDSYIDVRNFRGATDLARHLKYLDKNKTAYNEIVMNQLSLKCRLVEAAIPWHCQVCDYLKRNRANTDVVHDIARFWGMKKCQRPEEFFTWKENNDFNLPT